MHGRDVKARARVGFRLDSDVFYNYRAVINLFCLSDVAGFGVFHVAAVPGGAAIRRVGSAYGGLAGWRIFLGVGVWVVQGLE